MKTLTKAEEGIMQVLWKIDKGFLGEIIHEMPNPKPHQNTVATILKILVEKQFVGIETFGRMNRYYPLVKKYYEGSFSNIVSSMVKENNLSIEELEMLVKELKKGK